MESDLFVTAGPSAAGGSSAAENNRNHAVGASSATTKDKRGWSRQNKACISCRKQKMRCLPQPDGPCARCANTGRECHFDEAIRKRKPRAEVRAEAALVALQKLQQPLPSLPAEHSPHSIPSVLYSTSPTHLQDGPTPGRSETSTSTAPREQQVEGQAEAMIWHGLPHPALTPLGLLADASLESERRRQSILDPLDAPETSQPAAPPIGLANRRYFQTGNSILSSLRRTTAESQASLALLVDAILSPEEVTDLFALFFERCHPAAPILDPEVHTASNTAIRSPFLLSCVCAVASRYYQRRKDEDLYRSVLGVAKKLAADIIIYGMKSTEIVYGLFLLCQWNQPSSRFSEECSFQFSGFAIRMAIDLNLHCPAPPCPAEATEEMRTLYETEARNGERAWYYAFICDRSISNQLGKPYAISREDLIIRHARTWYLRPGATESDGPLAAVVELHKLVARALDVLYSDMKTLSGLNNNLDYPRLMRTFMNEIDEWYEWTAAFGSHNTLAFLHSYYRLFLLSFALQHTLTQPDSAAYLSKYASLCFESASNIIAIARDRMEPSGFLRYTLDCNFVFLTYSCCFLLKLLGPAFKNLVDPQAALHLVEEGTRTLERCAVNPSHTPAIYASFIRALVSNRRVSGSLAGTRTASPALADGALDQDATSAAPEVNLGGTFGDDVMDLDFLLEGSAFWDSMLFPGYGSVAGSGGVFPIADQWDTAARHSGQHSPFDVSFGFEQ